MYKNELLFFPYFSAAITRYEIGKTINYYTINRTVNTLYFSPYWNPVAVNIIVHIKIPVFK